MTARKWIRVDEKGAAHVAVAVAEHAMHPHDCAWVRGEDCIVIGRSCVEGSSDAPAYWKEIESEVARRGGQSRVGHMLDHDLLALEWSIPIPRPT